MAVEGKGCPAILKAICAPQASGIRLEVRGMDLLQEILPATPSPRRIARMGGKFVALARDSDQIGFQAGRERRGFRRSRLFPAAARI